ncbi:MAG: oligopeptide/dipeptide ABC transporter ATP-binding protein [Pseudohongiellaceae bacterium]
MPATDMPLLQVRDLKMHFPVKEGIFMRTGTFNKAVDGVSFDIMPGETLGLVGESGCGKSTLGRCITRLYRPTAGRILFDGTDLTHLKGRDLRPFRQNIQMIFQDPMESLNSRHTVGDILTEPFIIHNIGDKLWRRKRVAELLDIVGLPARSITRYPFEFSGGQRQRIGIARSIALNPRLVVCDEPVSALDVSIQSQIMNLLVDLQKEFNLSYLFIAHDLAVVKHVSDRIAIMYLGKVVEEGRGESIYREARHPYTQSLISAIPIPDPHYQKQRIILRGDVPSPINPPRGCTFHTRCPEVMDRCRITGPVLVPLGEDPEHRVSCYLCEPVAGAASEKSSDQAPGTAAENSPEKVANRVSEDQE